MRVKENIRREVFKRDKFSCVYCGSPALYVHHITSKSRGGTDELSNLVSICVPCHEKLHPQIAAYHRTKPRIIKREFIGTYYERIRRDSVSSRVSDNSLLPYVSARRRYHTEKYTGTGQANEHIESVLHREEN